MTVHLKLENNDRMLESGDNEKIKKRTGMKYVKYEHNHYCPHCVRISSGLKCYHKKENIESHTMTDCLVGCLL